MLPCPEQLQLRPRQGGSGEAGRFHTSERTNNPTAAAGPNRFPSLPRLSFPGDQSFPVRPS